MRGGEEVMRGLGGGGYGEKERVMIRGGDRREDEIFRRKGRWNESKVDDRWRTGVGEVGGIRDSLTEGVGIRKGLELMKKWR